MWRIMWSLFFLQWFFFLFGFPPGGGGGYAALIATTQERSILYSSNGPFISSLSSRNPLCLLRRPRISPMAHSGLFWLRWTEKRGSVVRVDDLPSIPTTSCGLSAVGSKWMGGKYTSYKDMFCSKTSKKSSTLFQFKFFDWFVPQKKMLHKFREIHPPEKKIFVRFDLKKIFGGGPIWVSTSSWDSTHFSWDSTPKWDLHLWDSPVSCCSGLHSDKILRILGLPHIGHDSPLTQQGDCCIENPIGPYPLACFGMWGRIHIIA